LRTIKEKQTVLKRRFMVDTTFSQCTPADGVAEIADYD
jgi:hypothetical protein